MSVTSITFGNTTVIASNEGGWQEPKLGFIQPAYQLKKLVNTKGELACPVAEGGCDHVITVNFINVAVNEVAGIQSRMKALKLLGVQTVTIPEWPAIPNCIVTNVEPANKRQARASFSGATLVLTPTKNLDYTITFHQLFD